MVPVNGLWEVPLGGFAKSAAFARGRYWGQEDLLSKGTEVGRPGLEEEGSAL